MDYKKLGLITLLLSLFVLSGCINIDVNQKMKRNGHYDLDLTISTSAEYKAILNGMKEGFQVHDSVKDKFLYDETDSAITFSFKDLDPSVDKKLFKDIVETEEEGTDDPFFGDLEETPDSSFVDPENIDFKKEFKFPYYEFTYTLRMTPEQEETSNAGPVTLSQDKYILDEAGILDASTKQDITRSINEIYKNDSIEVVVVTKSQMTSFDYFSYSYDFAQDFDFAGTQYIMVFVSTNEDGVCRVESNIFFDEKLSSFLFDLDSEFSQNCKASPTGEIRSAVEQLETYFQGSDVESTDELEAQLGELFAIGYTVEVFGTIVETNGQKLAGNKVKFDVNPAEEGEYTIVFQDFFLATILGDYYWVYLISAAVILVGAGGIWMSSRGKKNKPVQPPVVPLAIHPDLLDYVTKARASGMQDPQIRKNLVQGGWKPKDVDQALKAR